MTSKPDPYNPRTWPKDYTAQQIQQLLAPLVMKGETINFATMSSVLRSGDHHTIETTLRYIVFKQLKDSCEHGRVIARCCDLSQRVEGGAPWVTAALAFKPHRAFRLLVEEHLKQVVDPNITIAAGEDVYDAWMKATASKFPGAGDPSCTVLLDTCEILAGVESSTPHSTAPHAMKTALELLCGV
jgi:hypothetical protein